MRKKVFLLLLVGVLNTQIMWGMKKRVEYDVTENKSIELCDDFFEKDFWEKRAELIKKLFKDFEEGAFVSGLEMSDETARKFCDFVTRVAGFLERKGFSGGVSCSLREEGGKKLVISLDKIDEFREIVRSILLEEKKIEQYHQWYSKIANCLVSCTRKVSAGCAALACAYSAFLCVSSAMAGGNILDAFVERTVFSMFTTGMFFSSGNCLSFGYNRGLPLYPIRSLIKDMLKFDSEAWICAALNVKANSFFMMNYCCACWSVYFVGSIIHRGVTGRSEGGIVASIKADYNRLKRSFAEKIESCIDKRKRNKLAYLWGQECKAKKLKAE